jgi:hypothetical protein
MLTILPRAVAKSIFAAGGGTRRDWESTVYSLISLVIPHKQWYDAGEGGHVGG